MPFFPAVDPFLDAFDEFVAIAEKNRGGVRRDPNPQPPNPHRNHKLSGFRLQFMIPNPVTTAQDSPRCIQKPVNTQCSASVREIMIHSPLF